MGFQQARAQQNGLVPILVEQVSDHFLIVVKKDITDEALKKIPV